MPVSLFLNIHLLSEPCGPWGSVERPVPWQSVHVIRESWVTLYQSVLPPSSGQSTYLKVLVSPRPLAGQLGLAVEGGRFIPWSNTGWKLLLLGLKSSVASDSST